MGIYIAVGAIALIVGLLLGSAIGIAYRRNVAEKQIGSAEEQAAKIVEDAIKAAESKKKEALLEAKEEILKNRTETENELKERRKEVSRLERRIQQKEESLDSKTEALEKKNELLDHLLNSRGMDPSVADKLLERDARDLAANGVKAGNCNNIRRVINDEIDTGEGLDGSDVSALSTDDSTLHILIGELNCRNGNFADVVSSTTLDGKRKDVLSLFVCFFFKLFVKVRDFKRFFVGQCCLYAREKLVFRLFLCKSCKLFKNCNM